MGWLVMATQARFSHACGVNIFSSTSYVVEVGFGELIQMFHSTLMLAKGACAQLNSLSGSCTV